MRGPIWWRRPVIVNEVVIPPPPPELEWIQRWIGQRAKAHEADAAHMEQPGWKSRSGVKVEFTPAQHRAIAHELRQLAVDLWTDIVAPPSGAISTDEMGTR